MFMTVEALATVFCKDDVLADIHSIAFANITALCGVFDCRSWLHLLSYGANRWGGSGSFARQKSCTISRYAEPEIPRCIDTAYEPCSTLKLCFCSLFFHSFHAVSLRMYNLTCEYNTSALDIYIVPFDDKCSETSRLLVLCARHNRCNCHLIMYIIWHCWFVWLAFLVASTQSCWFLLCLALSALMYTACIKK